MKPRKIMVLSAGLGVPSSSRLLADQLAVATQTSLTELGVGAEIHVVELRDYAVDIANNFVTGFAAPRLDDLIKDVETADAIIAVSPVFSASFSGLFKSFFDVIDPKALEGTPVLLGATAGTDRHQMVLDYAMRPLFGYLRARVVPTAVFAGPQDWGSTDDGRQGGMLASRVTRAGRELAGIVAEAPAREKADDMVSLPFEQLLAGITAA
ncbi:MULTISPECIES: FMN reductase [Arthrobacter]|uniref:FMN reductase n=2 Tax=Arthrobacter TaxID=1663 RepID=A0ABU9KJ46_9MICC|nr:FMN reductase [Arthrobacter sp. YJM1]MDP5226836.1 FMN reductase [Arthrobacter sp. YJM1]